MLNSLALPLVGVLSVLLMSQPDARSILETARAKQAERWSTVRNYTVTLSVRDSGGLQTPVYYEKMKTDGKETFRMVPPGEYSSRMSEQAGFPPITPEGMEQMAQGLDMIGNAVAGGGGDMPAMDLRGMTGQMSTFLRSAASVPRDDGRADAKDAMKDMAMFAERARLDGTEPIVATSGDDSETREAYRIVADNLSDIDLEQPEGDVRFTLDKATLWIDVEDYVPLRLLMEGQIDNRGKKTPMSIEKLDLDYKRAGPLLESYRQVYKLGGMMAGLSEKDRKELEKAKKELEKTKKQLEKMPPAQKAMVMKMMGDKMEQMERMTQGGGDITSITDVVSIAVNEGPPTPYGLGTLTVGGAVAAEYPAAMTLATGDGRAELAIAARIPGHAQATIGLIGAGDFPRSGKVDIADASGSVELEGGVLVSIESGTGTITVTERTDTHILGTYTALLTGNSSTGDGTSRISFSASGKFDSGASAGPFQGLRGSPIPPDLFQK